MKVLFRVDAGVQIGSGHVMRTLTLARELAARGATTRFVCREMAGNLVDRILREGHELRILPAAGSGANGLQGYARWLGVSPEQDVADFLAAAKGFRADWLVVDHYALGEDWEREARKAADSILAVDDLANRVHDCDLLLDQNYFGPSTPDRYAALTPVKATQLLGPDYALLRPEFRQLRLLTGERQSAVRRLLVFFGAGDSANQTARVIEALGRAEFEQLDVDVVVGVNHPDPAGLAKLAAQRPGLTLHRDVPSLALLMAQADLAIGAGGSTTWERACLGLPALVQIAAENQRGFSVALVQAGLQFEVAEQATSDSWHAAISGAIADVESRARMSREVRKLTDGLGAARVCAAMRPVAPHKLCLVMNRDPGSSQIEAGLAEAASGLDYCRARIREGEQFDEVDSLQIGVSRTDMALRAHFLSRLAARGSAYLALAAKESFAGLRMTLLTDRGSFVNPLLERFVERSLDKGHRVRWVHDVTSLVRGDVCFILSFSSILSQQALAQHRHNLVVHASALPEGRGWSPMTWEILEGRSDFTLTLFEATAGVDAGVIYDQKAITLGGHELVDEWRRVQVDGIADLCERWLDRFPASASDSREQQGEATYYGRRTPAHSAIDAQVGLAQQFDLLRVVDNDRYPAWFEFRGHQYILSIKEKS